ncbi:MAG: hypothetical protein KBC64_03960 [Simkaniaceae bacterium]|nr:hypothetical protein [Simkaniaceae bacterium]
MEVSHHLNLTATPATPPPIASRLFNKDPVKLIKILQLIGKWTDTLFSPSQNSRAILKQIDGHLKETRSVIKLVLFFPTMITAMSNITHIKETLLKWLGFDAGTTQTVMEIAQSVIANHIAPFFESTSDLIETLNSLRIIDIGPYIATVQIFGGAALFIMSAHQVYCLAKRFFQGDTGGTYSLEVAKQVTTIAISILSIVGASTTIPFLAPAMLSLSTISLATSLLISLDKIEKEEANRVS